MKKIIPTVVVSLIAIGLLLATAVNSQTTANYQNAPTVSTQVQTGVSANSATPITPWCKGFFYNHSFGSTDVSSNGEVSVLQNFLSSQGYLNIPPSVSSGYFGSLTKNALASWQASIGVLPASGFFGPITRAKIASLCIYPPPPTSALHINYLSPSSGPVGTWVTIQGSGFTSDSRIQFGQGNIYPVVPACPANNCGSGTTLSFQIPESLGPNCTSGPCPTFATTLIRPGDYSVSVSNSNGTSNSVTFTVTSGQNNSRNPVIDGISAPTTLAVNETGTWKVSAHDPYNGTLSYSVNWGETPAFSTSGGSANTSASFQQSTSFTHSYSQAGTYNPTFIVRNSSGGEARVTTSVQVGVSQTNPNLSYLLPTSGNVGTSVTIRGSGLTSDSRIQFGQGSIQPATSNCPPNAAGPGTCDPSTFLNFQVPQYLSPYCPPGSECPQYVIQVTPGTYPIYVVNSNGTSNTLYFTVTGPCPRYSSCGTQQTY